MFSCKRKCFEREAQRKPSKLRRINTYFLRPTIRCPKEFSWHHDFLGIFNYCVVGAKIKIFNAGGFSLPSFTVRDLSLASVAKRVTAATNALQFSSVCDKQLRVSALHNSSRSNSSSVIKRHADETRSCFVVCASISSEIPQGHFIVDSAPSLSITTDNFNR